MNGQYTASMRRGAAILTASLMLVLLSGCGWHGVTGLTLPGTHGNGEGSWTVYVQFPDVSTITRNSEVQVNNVTVGRVADIRLEKADALLTLKLDRGVELPANATATIGQTTLLGSTHVALAPPTEERPAGRLTDGATVGIDRSGSYPTTEQTLASVALVLGGGGLDQIHTILTELNSAIGGRDASARAVIDGLAVLSKGLDAQRAQIVSTIESLDRLAADLANDNNAISNAITALDPALRVVADRRGDLTRALRTLGDFSKTAESIVQASGDDIRTNLRALPPIFASLANAGGALTSSMRYILTYPFPIDTAMNAVRGDYANGVVTLDLRLKTLDKALLTGTGLQGTLTGLQGILGRAAPPGASATGPGPTLPALIAPPPPPRTTTGGR